MFKFLKEIKWKYYKLHIFNHFDPQECEEEVHRNSHKFIFSIKKLLLLICDERKSKFTSMVFFKKKEMVIQLS